MHSQRNLPAYKAGQAFRQPSSLHVVVAGHLSNSSSDLTVIAGRDVRLFHPDQIVLALPAILCSHKHCLLTDPPGCLQDACYVLVNPLPSSPTLFSTSLLPELRFGSGLPERELIC